MSGLILPSTMLAVLPTTISDYSTFSDFDFERTWWRLFQNLNYLAACTIWYYALLNVQCRFAYCGTTKNVLLDV